MKTSRRILWLLAVSLVTGPALASAQDAKLYEVSENMKFTNGHLVRRIATASLVGFANPNTPLCPPGAVQTDPAAAARLLSQGESPRDGSLDGNELAAYTTVASLILNLDEVVTRQ